MGHPPRGIVNSVLVSRTGPLTKEYDTVAFPVSAGLRGSAVLTIGLYIAHFDNQDVNFDHQRNARGLILPRRCEACRRHAHRSPQF
jgi:hypothetical protein